MREKSEIWSTSCSTWSSREEMRELFQYFSKGTVSGDSYAVSDNRNCCLFLRIYFYRVLTVFKTFGLFGRVSSSSSFY
jgi:hypothetical protein